MQNWLSKFSVCAGSLLLSVSSARATYITGFEPSTYSIGSLSGQDGWTTTRDDINVSTANPSTGLQEIRYTSPTTGSGNQVATHTINAPAMPGTTTLTFRLANTASDYGGADRDILLRSANDTSDSSAVAGFKLSFAGQIATYINFPSFPSSYDLYDTGLTWDTTGAYHTFGIVINSLSNTLTYTYDGTLLNTATAFHGTTATLFEARTDAFYLTGESMDLDSLTVTTVAAPEPTMLGCVGLGAIGLLRRRAVTG